MLQQAGQQYLGDRLAQFLYLRLVPCPLVQQAGGDHEGKTVHGGPSGQREIDDIGLAVDTGLLPIADDTYQQKRSRPVRFVKGANTTAYDILT